MKTIPKILLFFTMLFAVESTLAQVPVLSANRIYGLNPALYNGKFYSYFAPAGTEGSQFLNGPDFVKGSAQINGKTFNDLLLNYDIYNQRVVLKYKTRMNNMMQIVLSVVTLESFNMGERHFEILSFPQVKTRVYQVLGNGPYKILYAWYKLYALDNSYGSTTFKFSKPFRESYVKVGDKRMRYGSNRSFVALFGRGNKSALNKYMRKNKIKVKKSSQQAILQLINYCNTLPSK